MSWVGRAVRFLVVGTISKEERPPRGQLWMEQYFTSFMFWPFLYTIRADPSRLVLQMWVPLAACHKPAGKLWQLCKVLYVFEHKMQYLLIHAPYTRIAFFFYTSATNPQRFRRVKFVLIPICFVQHQYLWNIAIQLVDGCYNSWANKQCSGCWPLGEISLWNWTIVFGVWPCWLTPFFQSITFWQVYD